MYISLKVKENLEKASWVRKMFEEGIRMKKEFGEGEVLDFSLGNPLMEPPDEFFEHLERIAGERKKGQHRYMPNAGFMETRQAVADQLSLETGLPFTPDHIIMVCGAAGGLNVAIKTIIDPGDEVIILAPYFVEYLFYLENHGARPVIAETGEDFLPDMEAIENALTHRTRAIIVNSPNNPTGRVYGEAFYRDLRDLLQKRERETGRPIYLLADEPYQRLVYEGIKPPRAFQYVPNCISVTSHSKDLSIPGERIGYMAVSPHCAGASEIIDGAAFCNRTLGFVNAPALAQRIVAGLQSLSVDVKDYEMKRDLLYGALKGIGYEIHKPEGAFYLFPKSPIPDDVQFVKILQREKVLTVPGSGFGRPGYFRIAYCVEEKTIRRSVDSFKKAWEEAVSVNAGL